MSEIQILLTQLDQAFERKSWHGTNLRGSLRGVTAAEAAARPAPDRHNIWELAVHAAYWKYIVRRRLTGESRGSFELAGSNFFARPDGDASDAAFKKDVDLLVRTHRSLRETIAALDPRQLPLKPRGSKVSNLDMILGIASHDLYHTGQIQLLKRLVRAS